MDVGTFITALAALAGAFVGSIGRPLAEDRVAKSREKRAAKDQRHERARARIDSAVALLAEVSYGPNTPRWNQARASLRSAVASVNDERLTEYVGRYEAEDGADALNSAKWRAGELQREIDEQAGTRG